MRVHWEQLPPEIRAAIEERLGSPVVDAATQPGGFSPGLASRLRLEDGRRVFVKAVSDKANPDSPKIHRKEARIVAALPESAPVPRLLWTYDDAGWVALAFEDIDGRHPDEPWTEADLALVAGALRDLASALTPSPIDFARPAGELFVRTINGWGAAIEREEQRLDAWTSRNLERLADLEARAPNAAVGRSLVHFDIRADNLLISGERVYVLDWPWARIGASFIDWVGMAPSVAMQGGPGPEDFLRRFDMTGVDPWRIDAVVCSLAGYFVVHGMDPPSPGLPTLREFQSAQGRIAQRWLRERTGWV